MCSIIHINIYGASIKYEHLLAHFLPKKCASIADIFKQLLSPVIEIYIIIYYINITLVHIPEQMTFNQFWSFIASANLPSLPAQDQLLPLPSP